VIKMGEKGKSEPIPIKEMFSDINIERVRDLMDNRDFQAKVGLNEAIEQSRKLNNGELSRSIEVAYQPAFSALTNKLTKEGWSPSEQRAAHMVTRGELKLR